MTTCIDMTADISLGKESVEQKKSEFENTALFFWRSSDARSLSASPLELRSQLFDAACTQSSLNIDSLSDVTSAHKHKHASPNSARNASHYSLFELYQRLNHRGGKKKIQNTAFDSGCGSTRPLQKGSYQTNIPFVHASCVWMCIVHLSYFMFHNHGGQAACRVTPGTHQEDGAAFQTRLQISHERKTLLFLLLTCKQEALLGQLSCRNMARRWSRAGLC